LVPFDLAKASVLLVTPPVRHFLEERHVHKAVELVYVYRVDSVLKALVFGLKPLDRFLVFTPFVDVASMQRVAHPFQHLFVELQKSQQLGELLSSTSSRT
jgi:hypothetical protein